MAGAGFGGPLLIHCSINKLENFRRTENREQIDREFNYRGHSYPLWIVGGERANFRRTENREQTDKEFNKWQGPAFGARSWGRKNTPIQYTNNRGPSNRHLRNQ